MTACAGTLKTQTDVVPPKRVPSPRAEARRCARRPTRQHAAPAPPSEVAPVDEDLFRWLRWPRSTSTLTACIWRYKCAARTWLGDRRAVSARCAVAAGVAEVLEVADYPYKKAAARKAAVLFVGLTLSVETTRRDACLRGSLRCRGNRRCHGNRKPDDRRGHCEQRSHHEER